MNDLDRSAIHQQSSGFLQAGEAAQALSDLFRDEGVPLHPHSSLGRLIADAIALATDWANGKIINDQDHVPLIRGQHLDKIAWAALPLGEAPNRVQHLADLRRGNLDPLAREPSPGKDKLWELELWRQFNDFGIPSTLAEPDIVASTPMGDIAVACKRIYSEKNASKPISQGVRQIEATGLPGILAIAIDDVAIPAGHVVHGPNIQFVAAALNQLNLNFIRRFEGTLLRYISTGRISTVAVSTSAAIYLDNAGIRECRQTQFWTHPALSPEKTEQMSLIARRLFGQAS
jgi:hypothetical protein